VDDALRRRVDAVVALLFVAATLLAALVATRNPATLVGAGLVAAAGLAAWYVARPRLA